MQDIDPRAAEAEAYLRANGVEGITIKGGGDEWFVAVGFAEHERFVTAYSAKNPFTPTDPLYLAQQALAALIRNERPTKPLATEATLEPVAVLSEAEETAAHESDSETGEEADGGGIGGGQEDAGNASPGHDPGSAGNGVVRGEGEAWKPDAELSPDFVLDADFEDAPDLGAELLDDEAFAHGELPAPDPLDFAPDEIEPESEHATGAFIFGDNLAHDRIIRIGQLSEHATELIAAAKAGYSDAEHDAVRSHVVTHLNEAGAYVGGNPKLFDRFIELETVTARIRRIEMYRDERQDFIRSADREAVAAFEPAAGWP